MTYRVGIAGFGVRAALWRHVHRLDLGAQVAAVADPSPRGQADARAALPDAVVTDRLDRLLDAGVDAVMVLAPDHLHHRLATEALRAGVAVFCEKPLATTLEDCDDILRVARETGSRLYVGHNMRHMPVVRMLRELVTTGRIGAVQTIWCRHFVGHGGDFYFRDWHADRRSSTGLLLQKGAHDLDVMHWLAGGSSRLVAAMGALRVYGAGDGGPAGSAGGGEQGRAAAPTAEQRMTDWYDPTGWPPRALDGLNPVVDVEDVSTVIMTLDNGVLGTYSQCHFTPDYWRNYTVIGDAGRIENVGDGPGGEVRLWDRRHPAWADPDQTLVIPGGTDGHGGADKEMVEEFLHFARDGGPTETSPVAARDAVAAAVAATSSLRGGSGAVPVPPLDPALVRYFEDGQDTRRAPTSRQST